jgi:hypothetical protein
VMRFWNEVTGNPLGFLVIRDRLCAALPRSPPARAGGEVKVDTFPRGRGRGGWPVAAASS